MTGPNRELVLILVAITTYDDGPVPGVGGKRLHELRSAELGP